MSKVVWFSPSSDPGSALGGDRVNPAPCDTSSLAEAEGNSVVKSKHEKYQFH